MYVCMSACTHKSEDRSVLILSTAGARELPKCGQAQARPCQWSTPPPS